MMASLYFEFLPQADGLVNDARIFHDADLLWFWTFSLVASHCSCRYRPRGQRAICIDHTVVDADFADVFVHDVTACSVGEMIYRLVVAFGAELSRDVATPLFAQCTLIQALFAIPYIASSACSCGEFVRAGVDVWDVTSGVYDYPVGRITLLGGTRP